MNTGRITKLLLIAGMVATLVCAGFCSRVHAASTNEAPVLTTPSFSSNAPANTTPSTSGSAGLPTGSSPTAADQVGDGYCKSIFIPISLALVVGVCGAWCFYSGVRYGLIDRNSRDVILKHLPNKEIPILFCMLGGIVAAVFQAAQPHVFAPIQAFVLGATWPSVVTRIMSGSGSGSSLTDMAPQDIKPPPGSKTTTPEPEVVIKP